MPDPVELVIDFPDPIISYFEIDKMGPAGTNGQGLVPGGTTGQQLVKKSNADFDTEWVPSNVAPIWGDVSGNITDQIDLQNSLNGKVPVTRSINTTSPLSGGGNLSADR